MSRSLSRTYFSRRVKRILSMKAENLPDLIKYLTVIYFSLFSVFYAILMMPGLQNFASMASSIIIFIRRHCLQCLILSAAESNNVEAYISFLRKKFHYLDSKVTIGTVRKVCYRLESEETS